MEWTIEEALETYEVFKWRTAEDLEFRALALVDPEAAVKQLSGLELPDQMELRVHEGAGGELELSILFVMPMEEQVYTEAELLEAARRMIGETAACASSSADTA